VPTAGEGNWLSRQETIDTTVPLPNGALINRSCEERDTRDEEDHNIARSRYFTQVY